MLVKFTVKIWHRLSAFCYPSTSELRCIMIVLDVLEEVPNAVVAYNLQTFKTTDRRHINMKALAINIIVSQEVVAVRAMCSRNNSITEHFKRSALPVVLSTVDGTNVNEMLTYQQIIKVFLYGKRRRTKERHTKLGAHFFLVALAPIFRYHTLPTK